MKKAFLIFLCISLFCLQAINVYAVNSSDDSVNTSTDFSVNANSAVLIDAATGEVLFKYNESEKASPASVTKIMTILLVMEAIENEKIKTTDNVVISSYAASMGGSQVFLEEGESMSVEELLKCAIIASANDAAVALAEHVGGSEAYFVSMMNKRAEELGMKNTCFENVTGLDDTTTQHLTSAEDIAIMSRMLIKYDLVRKYSSLWQDTIRNGEFTLTNTNRLVRYYDGCNGLKTGSTDKAGYCISASAERDGMQLIAVIMGAKTRDIRNAEARALLDYGFSNYSLYTLDERALEDIPVYCGTVNTVTVYSKPFSAIIPKGESKNVNLIFDIPEAIDAPVEAMTTVGKITYMLGDKIIGTSEIYVAEGIDEIGFVDIFFGIIKSILIG